MRPTSRWPWWVLLCLVALGALSACILGPEEPANSPLPPVAEEPVDGGADGPSEPPATRSPTGNGGAGGPAEPTATPSSGLSGAELDACSTVYYSDEEALEAYDELANRPVAEQDAASRVQVALMFEDAAGTVESQLELLPTGEVRSAVLDYQAAQLRLSDALRSGGDVTVDELFRAADELAAACAGG